MRNRENADDKPQARALGWKVTGTSYPIATPWLTLRCDEVRTVGDDCLTHTYVQAAPSVFIVPVTAGGEVVLIRQYRDTVDAWCLKVPAGGTSGRPGQALADVAREELREEIGATCDDVCYIAALYPWSSRSNQIAHVFLVLGVQLEGRQQLEAPEHIELVPMRVEDALTMARGGDITDGQSALCILLCEGPLREMGYLE